MDIRKKLFDNFNKFIVEQDTDPYEVCLFIHSLLSENNYGYCPTGCYGNDWILYDGSHH